MGRTSNAVKQKWCKENLTQVKVSVPPAIAAAFKVKCQIDGVSMASELSRFMSGAGCESPHWKTSIHRIVTRPQRRKAVAVIVEHLERILDAEGEYIACMPPGIDDSIRRSAADETMNALEEALELLREAY
jgi:predicted DNA-binding protein (UPF0278 family)